MKVNPNYPSRNYHSSFKHLSRQKNRNYEISIGNYILVTESGSLIPKDTIASVLEITENEIKIKIDSNSKIITIPKNYGLRPISQEIKEKIEEGRTPELTVF